jgi:hypothetical protein
VAAEADDADAYDLDLSAIAGAAFLPLRGSRKKARAASPDVVDEGAGSSQKETAAEKGLFRVTVKCVI